MCVCVAVSSLSYKDTSIHIHAYSNGSELWKCVHAHENNKYISKALNPSIDDLHEVQSAVHA